MLRIAAIQLRASGDKARTLERASSLIKEAAARGAKLGTQCSFQQVIRPTHNHISITPNLLNILLLLFLFAKMCISLFARGMDWSLWGRAFRKQRRSAWCSRHWKCTDGQRSKETLCLRLRWSDRGLCYQHAAVAQHNCSVRRTATSA